MRCHVSPEYVLEFGPRELERTAMKIFRFTCLVTLGLIAFIGLISFPFTSTIAAHLKLPGVHRPGAAIVSSTLQAYVPTRTPGVASSPKAQAPGASAPLAWDNFRRADRVYWGMTSDRHMWGGEANHNPAFVITNQRGMIMQGHGIYNAILGARVSDAEVVFSGSLSSFQNNNIGAVLRWNDANSWYKAYIDGERLVLASDVAGAIRTLDAVPFPASSTTSYSLRFRIQGTQLFARAWPAGQAEPRAWMADARNAAIPSGFGGLRLVVLHGSEAIISAFTEVAVKAP
jgi:hypothetical protein